MSVIGKFPNFAIGNGFALWHGVPTECYNSAAMETEVTDKTPPEWGASDLAFAIRELRQEFPSKAEHLIVAAVHVAAERTSPAAGRVRLVQNSREIARRSS